LVLKPAPGAVGVRNAIVMSPAWKRSVVLAVFLSLRK
jgi:hypothetical protein